MQTIDTTTSITVPDAGDVSFTVATADGASSPTYHVYLSMSGGGLSGYAKAAELFTPEEVDALKGMRAKVAKFLAVQAGAPADFEPASAPPEGGS